MEIAKLIGLLIIVQNLMEEIKMAEEERINNERENLEIILMNNTQIVAEMRKSDSGMYKVLGSDKLDGSDWIHRCYNVAEEALQEARKMTKEAMNSSSAYIAATVYYAFDPQGNYLGGDTWHKE